MNIEELKYPIGKYSRPGIVTPEMFAGYTEIIAAFPAKIIGATSHLNDEQTDTAYRPEGWTIRQVVHHCADSHMNSFIRLKLALTEDNPTIKPYEENLWAELPDGKSMPVEPSLKMIEGIHQRWVSLLRTLSPEDLAKTFYHPESKMEWRIDINTSLYAWHSEHHLAHITMLINSKGWK